MCARDDSVGCVLVGGSSALPDFVCVCYGRLRLVSCRELSVAIKNLFQPHRRVLMIDAVMCCCHLQHTDFLSLSHTHTEMIYYIDCVAGR